MDVDWDQIGDIEYLDAFGLKAWAVVYPATGVITVDDLRTTEPDEE